MKVILFSLFLVLTQASENGAGSDTEPVYTPGVCTDSQSLNINIGSMPGKDKNPIKSNLGCTDELCSFTCTVQGANPACGCASAIGSKPTSAAGCVYICNQSFNLAEKKNTPIDAQVHIKSNTAECINYDIMYASTTTTYEYCSTGKSCSRNVEDATQISINVYRWKCDKCYTQAEDGDFYKLAPYIFDTCCEKCASKIEALGLNKETSPNFMICQGCDGEGDSLDNLEDYLKAPQDTEALTGFEGIFFAGNLTVADNDENNVETKQDFSCKANIEPFNIDTNSKIFDCSTCSDNGKEECCKKCVEAYEDTANEGTVFSCRGCDDEGNIDSLVEKVYDLVCKDSVTCDSSSRGLFVSFVVLCLALLLL